MTRLLVGFIIFACCSTLGVAQGIDFDYSHEQFSIDIKEKLSLGLNPVSITIGESFTLAWSTFGPDVRNKIIFQTKTLVADGHRLQPNLESYFASIAYAVNNEHLSSSEVLSYLNMTLKVIEELFC